MSKKTSDKPHLLVIEARFYDEISDALLEGATNRLLKEDTTFDVVTVPGALEVPATIAMALKGKTHYDGFVALGCVIRGETYHFDIVSNESCRALTDLSVRKGIAIGNGILTVEDDKQAFARANPEDKDKGGFAADAALQMIAMKKRLGA